MSNATPVQLAPVDVSWRGDMSQNPPQTPLRLMKPAVPFALSCNTGLCPTVPFHQPSSFIDPLSHCSIPSPGHTVLPELPPDDLESDYESEDSSVVSSSLRNSVSNSRNNI